MQQQFKVSVAEILGHPGEYRDVTISARLSDVSNALGRLTGDPVEGRLRVESVVEGVLVTGRVQAPAEFDCARCLKPVPATLEVELCELFTAPGHEAPPEEESYRIEDQDIDLEPMLRDAVALAMPLKPVCTEDCKGICPTCGHDLNAGECSCSEEELDPRWAALSDLRDKLA